MQGWSEWRDRMREKSISKRREGGREGGREGREGGKERGKEGEGGEGKEMNLVKREGSYAERDFSLILFFLIAGITSLTHNYTQHIYLYMYVHVCL